MAPLEGWLGIDGLFWGIIELLLSDGLPIGLVDGLLMDIRFPPVGMMLPLGSSPLVFCAK